MKDGESRRGRGRGGRGRSVGRVVENDGSVPGEVGCDELGRLCRGYVGGEVLEELGVDRSSRSEGTGGKLLVGLLLISIGLVVVRLGMMLWCLWVRLIVRVMS